MQRLVLLACCMIAALFSRGQQLKPGFDAAEYLGLMRISAQFGDSAYARPLQPHEKYLQVYRSPVMGLMNMWDLWSSSSGINVISIRGTTAHEISWMANFYAAMVPAKGSMMLQKDLPFEYDLADDLQAAVHAGWLTATGFIAHDLLPKMDSCIRAGKKEFLIIGHSQGGAIAYLLTALLIQMQAKQKLDAGVVIKTYCSAAPKPGNLYFAYEYEHMTRDGWAFNVINTADWVPQTPFSIQTVDDLSPVNPFAGAPEFIDRQGWPKKMLFAFAYGRLTKPGRNAAENYRRYLGNFLRGRISQHLPGHQPPAFLHSNDYVRTGNTIVLRPGKDYPSLFPPDTDKIFVNHLHQPYIYLTEQLYPAR